MRTPLLDSSVRCMSMIATLSLASGASANLLANPGYESTAFTASSNVLANFAAYQGAWGILAGGITPATAGVTPADGAQMLCMVGAGQLITNTVQVVDVSSAAALIGTGSAVVNASALYNTNGGYSGAVGRLRARFYSGPSQSSLLGSSTLASFTLDSDPATWQQASIAAAIPVGTNWILYEVSYTGASLAGNTGFVDQSSMTIGAVPAPGALALLALAEVVGRRRR